MRLGVKLMDFYNSDFKKRHGVSDRFAKPVDRDKKQNVRKSWYIGQGWSISKDIEPMNLKNNMEYKFLLPGVHFSEKFFKIRILYKYLGFVSS